MKPRIAKIYHPFRAYPNQLVVTVGFDLGIEREMEEVAFDVVIEKPEAELRALSFEQIERLAIERAKELLAAVMRDSL
jgi:hypothetical protein